MLATVPPNLQLRANEQPGRRFRGHNTWTVKATYQVARNYQKQSKQLVRYLTARPGQLVVSRSTRFHKWNPDTCWHTCTHTRTHTYVFIRARTDAIHATCSQFCMHDLLYINKCIHTHGHRNPSTHSITHIKPHTQTHAHTQLRIHFQGKQND